MNAYPQEGSVCVNNCGNDSVFVCEHRLFRMLSCSQTCTYPVPLQGKATEGESK